MWLIQKIHELAGWALRKLEAKNGPPFVHANGTRCYGCQICFADMMEDDDE